MKPTFVFPIQTTYVMFSRQFPFCIFINLHTYARHQIMMESGVRQQKVEKTLPVFTLKGLFRWREGDPGRCGNPLIWIKKLSAFTCNLATPSSRGTHSQDYLIVAKKVDLITIKLSCKNENRIYKAKLNRNKFGTLITHYTIRDLFSLHNKLARNEIWCNPFVFSHVSTRL